jgi:hypothetical protein
MKKSEEDKQRRQRLEILVESKDLDVIREKIERDYGFVATDAYIKDLIAFVQDMMDGRDDRNPDQ